jgi:hypothetical protein
MRRRLDGRGGGARGRGGGAGVQEAGGGAWEEGGGGRRKEMAPTGGPHLSAAVRKRRSAGPRGKAGPHGDGPEIWAAAEKKIRKEGKWEVGRGGFG